jgi:hypothetical protein
MATTVEIMLNLTRALDEEGDAGLVRKSSSVLTRLLGEPLTSDILSIAAWARINALISLGGVNPYACRYKAATPATCGLAMEVPLMVLVAVSLVNHVERISVPCLRDEFLRQRRRSYCERRNYYYN